MAGSLVRRGEAELREQRRSLGGRMGVGCRITAAKSWDRPKAASINCGRSHSSMKGISDRTESYSLHGGATIAVLATLGIDARESSIDETGGDRGVRGSAAWLVDAETRTGEENAPHVNKLCCPPKRGKRRENASFLGLAASPKDSVTDREPTRRGCS